MFSKTLAYFIKNEDDRKIANDMLNAGKTDEQVTEYFFLKSLQTDPADYSTEVDDFVESVIGMTDEEFETAVNDLYYREDDI